MRINLKIIAIGLLVYLLIFLVLSLLGGNPYLQINLITCIYGSRPDFCSFSRDLMFLAPLLSGSLVGALSKSYAVFNGLMLGILGSFIIYAINYNFDIDHIFNSYSYTNPDFYLESLYYLKEFFLLCPLSSAFVYLILRAKHE